MAVPFGEKAIARHLPPGPDGNPPQVRDLVPLVGGATSEIWSFSAGPDALVLRRTVRLMTGAPSISTQAAAMLAAAAAGMPVPQVYAWGDDDPELGAFTIMGRVDGETIPRRIQRAPELAGARNCFAAQSGGILARLGALDPQDVPGLPSGNVLDGLAERLRQLGAPSATFEWALRHLAANRPACSPATVVHGDFRLGNLVIGSEGIRAVLDWEGVHLGDPLEDLGWLCCKTWRFGGSGAVGGFGTREELVRAYAAAGGPVIDLGELAWWELYASLKWGVICMEQALRHFSGTPSVELAAVGRRVAEVEWDLLGLLP